MGKPVGNYEACDCIFIAFGFIETKRRRDGKPVLYGINGRFFEIRRLVYAARHASCTLACFIEKRLMQNHILHKPFYLQGGEIISLLPQP